jgi:hypothetical protein
MILKENRRPSPRAAYAAWLAAAAEAHRTGSEDLKARAERLYIESKWIERRAAKARAAMKRN